MWSTGLASNSCIAADTISVELLFSFNYSFSIIYLRRLMILHAANMNFSRIFFILLGFEIVFTLLDFFPLCKLETPLCIVSFNYRVFVS